MNVAVGKYVESRRVKSEFTRPADTTAYAVNDVVTATTAAMLTFAMAAGVGLGTGLITAAKIVTDQKANTAAFRLYLYDTLLTGLTADNAAFGLLWANRSNNLGYIDFPALSSEDATASSAAASLATGLMLPYRTDVSRSLYGVLVAKTVFTPANAQNISVELVLDANS